MRHAVCALAVLALLGLAGHAEAQAPHRTTATATPDSPWLLILSAATMSFDGNVLILQGVSPTSVAFTDWPARVATAVPLDVVVAGWGKGKDSLAKNPPSADLTVVRAGEIHTAVVTLASPRRSGSSLAYQVRILEGAVPASGGPTSLFIDDVCLACW